MLQVCPDMGAGCICAFLVLLTACVCRWQPQVCMAQNTLASVLAPPSCASAIYQNTVQI